MDIFFFIFTIVLSSSFFVSPSWVEVDDCDGCNVSEVGGCEIIVSGFDEGTNGWVVFLKIADAVWIGPFPIWTFDLTPLDFFDDNFGDTEIPGWGGPGPISQGQTSSAEKKEREIASMK